MSKLIVKTALSTLAAILILILLSFGILSLGFPSTMARLCLRMNLKDAALQYAVAESDRSNKAADIAFSVECAIYAEKEEALIVCMGQLEACEDRENFFAEKEAEDEGYRQYLYGQYAVALYRQGRSEEALSVAFDVSGYLHSFPANNAVIALSVEAISAQDKELCGDILKKLASSGYRNEDMTYIMSMLSKEIDE